MNTNETNPHLEKVEKLAEQLHIWYLEATKERNPASYNPNAQKSYAELTDEQRFIDRYIAEKILFSQNHLLEGSNAGETNARHNMKIFLFFPRRLRKGLRSY